MKATVSIAATTQSRTRRAESLPAVFNRIGRRAFGDTACTLALCAAAAVATIAAIGGNDAVSAGAASASLPWLTAFLNRMARKGGDK